MFGLYTAGYMGLLHEIKTNGRFARLFLLLFSEYRYCPQYPGGGSGNGGSSPTGIPSTLPTLLGDGVAVRGANSNTAPRSRSNFRYASKLFPDFGEIKPSNRSVLPLVKSFCSCDNGITRLQIEILTLNLQPSLYPEQP